MVAHAVKEAVGIGRDARGGGRNQRTERGGGTFKRHLGEQVAIDIGVERWIGFNKVAAGLDGYGGGSRLNLHHQFEARPDCRAQVETLALRRKPRCLYIHVIDVEWDVVDFELAGSIGR